MVSFQLSDQSRGHLQLRICPSSLALSVSLNSISNSVSRIDHWVSDSADGSNSPTAGEPHLYPTMSNTAHLSDEPNCIFTSNQFLPNSPSYLHLIPACLDLFTEHIYPIMPLIHMPTLRASIHRPLEMSEKNLLYALCALTSTHMSGKIIQAPETSSWEATGRFFLDECLLVRQSYDFVEDKTLSAVISSYFVSTAFFEINQSRKSWYYLREAMTLGQDLGLHNEKSYVGLPEAESLCRRRTFWILYITERYVCVFFRTSDLNSQKIGRLPSYATSRSLSPKPPNFRVLCMSMKPLKYTQASCT